MGHYQPHHEALSRYCYSMTHDQDAAKDLLSETVLKTFEQYESIKEKAYFKSYMFSVANKIYLKSFRQEKFKAKYDEKIIELKTSALSSPEHYAELSLLYDALQKLPTEQREALVLFEINGFNLKEIAVIQNCGLSAVKSRLRRGREKLEGLLTTDYDSSTPNSKPNPSLGTTQKNAL